MSLAVGWNRCVVTPILLPSKGILVLRHAHPVLILNSVGGSGLSETEADLYQEWIDNDRELRALIQQMRQIAAKATELIEKTPHPSRAPQV